MGIGVAHKMVTMWLGFVMQILQWSQQTTENPHFIAIFSDIFYVWGGYDKKSIWKEL